MSEMKPMKGTLTPTQIWQVVHYIRSIGPAALPGKTPPGKK
jgi:mono/diheme cytochrome c family protein